MPLRTRVTSLGELIADRRRGLVYGNRDVCTTSSGVSAATTRGALDRLPVGFRGRRRHPLLQPGRFTELFFLDDAPRWPRGTGIRTPEGRKPNRVSKPAP
jgi:hypothetical protein